MLSSEEFQVSAIESFRQLEEKLEDRTNRQLRQTIVVKGIPEKEKWTDTRNLLAKHVSKYYKMYYPIKTHNKLFSREFIEEEAMDFKKGKKEDVTSLRFVLSGMTASISCGIPSKSTSRSRKRIVW